MAREENRISEIKAQPDECALGGGQRYAVWGLDGRFCQHSNKTCRRRTGCLKTHRFGGR